MSHFYTTVRIHIIFLKVQSFLHRAQTSKKPPHLDNDKTDRTLSFSSWINMLIKEDDLSTSAIRSLLSLHVAELQSKTPSGSCYVLDVSSLQESTTTVFSAWDGQELLGCGALTELSPTHGEIKSMRTAAAHLRKGVGRAMVQHIISVAKSRGYTGLRLETGSDASFATARALYYSMGFEFCGPFGEYAPSEHNCFMTLTLSE
jgi:putative acetyltransferase